MSGAAFWNACPEVARMNEQVILWRHMFVTLTMDDAVKVHVAHGNLMFR